MFVSNIFENNLKINDQIHLNQFYEFISKYLAKYLLLIIDICFLNFS